MANSLDCPTLQQRRRKAQLEMFSKFHHGLISISSSYPPRPSSSRRSSRKNNDHSYDIPSCRTQHRQMSVFSRTVPDWNRLSQEIVAAELPSETVTLSSLPPPLQSLLTAEPLKLSLPPPSPFLGGVGGWGGVDTPQCALQQQTPKIMSKPSTH